MRTPLFRGPPVQGSALTQRGRCLLCCLLCLRAVPVSALDENAPLYTPRHHQSAQPVPCSGSSFHQQRHEQATIDCSASTTFQVTSPNITEDRLQVSASQEQAHAAVQIDCPENLHTPYANRVPAARRDDFFYCLRVGKKSQVGVASALFTLTLLNGRAVLGWPC